MYMLNHGLKRDKWVLANSSHSIDRCLTHLFLGRTSYTWLHTRGVTTRMAALRLYNCRRNVRDRDYECDRGISIGMLYRRIRRRWALWLVDVNRCVKSRRMSMTEEDRRRSTWTSSTTGQLQNIPVDEIMRRVRDGSLPSPTPQKTNSISTVSTPKWRAVSSRSYSDSTGTLSVTMETSSIFSPNIIYALTAWQ